MKRKSKTKTRSLDFQSQADPGHLSNAGTLILNTSVPDAV